MGKLIQPIEINGQPQQQQQQPQPTTQQQYLSTCSSTMPAMPKEKATAVSLSESHFSELKLKELATSATVVAATAAAAMATTTTTRLQQQHTCGCGASSAADIVIANSISNGRHGSSSNINNINNTSNSNKYMTTNGHSSPSPLAAAVVAQQQQQITTTTILSPQRNSSCCRLRQQQQNGHSNNSSEQQQMRTNNDATAATAGTGRVPYLVVPVATASYASASSSSSCASSSTSTAAAAAVTPPKKSPKDFFFGKYIGEGSFSNVYLAVDVNTKREYAIKVCEKRHILREHKQEYIRREREVMHMMTNVPGFVNLSCTFQDNRSLYFVMTYAKNGDLLPYINKVGSFDVDCTRHYAAELVLACEQMHRRNVVHRDLKPENILLDEDMHILIADFGSAKVLTVEERSEARATAANTEAAKATEFGTTKFGTAATLRQSRAQQIRRNYINDVDDDDSNTNEDEDDVDGGDSTNDTGSDDVDSPSRGSGSNSNRRQQQGRYYRKRKGSFVGTAQYVSPEVLQNRGITPSADLWALGCIVYQMISGLPPFRGSNDYVIFREILACNLDFPQGFDKDAEDLVRRLLVVDPAERLGALDTIEDTTAGCYETLRAHPFFASVDFNAVRDRMPPPIYPYLPGVSKDEEFRSHYRVPENLETGLDDKQLTRLLGMELGTSLGGDSDVVELHYLQQQHQQLNGGSNACPAGKEIEKKTVIKNIFDLSDAEKQRRLEQQKSDKWHVFADNEVILKMGFINKRKGLFARKRMLLLTTGPRLIYIDPVQMIKKGEIPWSAELRVEPKNFKIFFVHTPNRTYYLEDPEGYSLEWVEAIENMRKLTYKDQTTTTATTPASMKTGKNSLSATTKTTSHALSACAAGTTAMSKTASN